MVRALPRCLFVVPLLVATTVTAAPETVRLDSLRQDIDKLAVKVQALVAREKQSSLSIGQFTFDGQSQLHANAGPGIEELLGVALEKLQPGMVQPKAELTVEGRYHLAPDPLKPARELIELKLALCDSDGTELVILVALLHNTADVAASVGFTGVLTPGGNKDERAAELAAQLEKPLVALDGPRVKPAADSPLAVEIRARPADSAAAAVARQPTLPDGQAFVDLKQGELYEIVLFNDSEREVAAAVTIDGLSAFTFSEVRDPETTLPAYTHYIVPAQGSVTIVGWHLRDKTPDNYSQFLVTEYGKGASARAPRPTQGETGVISVAFAFSYPAGTRGGSETGFGPPRSVNVQPVQRDVDRPHAFVTVRYAR